MFTTVGNSVFVTSTDLSRIVVWSSDLGLPPQNLSDNLNQPKGLSVSSTGDIYVDSGLAYNRVEAWTSNLTHSTNSWNVTGSCFALFLVKNDTLYCSLGSLHQVVSLSLVNPPTTPTLVAGTGASGSSPDMLNNPYGIFVNAALDLYVADSSNNRIQMFPHGCLNATTVAGDGAPDTVALNQPRAVVLDAVGVLFIVDTMNHRIVASGPNGFRCIIGCTGANGSAVNQLNIPVSLSFDRDGNLLVVDQGNARIQNFSLASNSCRKFSLLFMPAESMHP